MAPTLTLFEALPGLEAPLESIGKSMAAMWESTAAEGKAAPPSEDSKATQVNLVLHLGFRTTVEDGVEQFQVAVRFSRRYPCRVVVLCPLPEEDGQGIRAKVYGECTVGKSPGDTRCCEFVLLSYARSARPFLESQVSVCLSTDLPLYYWAHGFSASSRLADYRYLLTNSKRVLIDSATAPADALTYPWPRPEAVRDLAYARTLPVRQSLGQFLSRYPMEALCSGLEAVTIHHGPAVRAESNALLRWLQDRIGQCGRNDATYTSTTEEESPPGDCRVRFRYAGSKLFSWKADLQEGTARFEADFGTGRTRLPAAVSLLAPEMALSEAMFF